MTREAPGNTESLGADPSDLRCFSARRESDAGLWGPPVPNRETRRHGAVFPEGSLSQNSLASYRYAGFQTRNAIFVVSEVNGGAAFSPFALLAEMSEGTKGAARNVAFGDMLYFAPNVFMSI